ncbi:MAG: arginine repressor [Candidatus Dormibacteraeota bacterium]|nr:arginine repressor [Candidatus Dormibacteraeota bacterium]
MTSAEARRERQSAILELLRSRPVRTQGELADELHRRRIAADQTTISRDLRQLGVLRAASGSERRYLAPADPEPQGRLLQLLALQLLEIDVVGSMVILHTPSGAAQVVALAVDSLRLPQVAGTVAGDDTIFVQARSAREAKTVVERLRHACRENAVPSPAPPARGG